jgi:hypothetical protein
MSSSAFLVCLVLAAGMASYCQSSHILLVPFPYPSVVSEFVIFGKALVERGHRITILLSSNYPKLQQVRENNGFRVVAYPIIGVDYYDRSGDSGVLTVDVINEWSDMDTIDHIRLEENGKS